MVENSNGWSLLFLLLSCPKFISSKAKKRHSHSKQCKVSDEAATNEHSSAPATTFSPPAVATYLLLSTWLFGCSLFRMASRTFLWSFQMILPARSQPRAFFSLFAFFPRDRLSWKRVSVMLSETKRTKRKRKKHHATLFFLFHFSLSRSPPFLSSPLPVPPPSSAAEPPLDLPPFSSVQIPPPSSSLSAPSEDQPCLACFLAETKAKKGASRQRQEMRRTAFQNLLGSRKKR